MQMFKFLKVLLASVVLLSLTACGGHGFEGTYRTSVDSTNPNSELVQYQKNIAKNNILIIGDNFMEAKGKRSFFEEITVREVDDKEFLVFIEANKKESLFEIVNGDQLRLRVTADTAFIFTKE